MSMYLRDQLSERKNPTPVSQPIPGREAAQVKNSAGGYVFPVDDFGRLDRFLILGSEGGTYYASEKKLTKDNLKSVERAIQADGPRVVARLVELSDSGRAPKNDPALLVLAMCAASTDDKTRRAALAALPKVARIGTHLFHFVEFVEAFRGWGRALRRAIGNWYVERSVGSLTNQVVKYRQRDGWSHRDLLRLSHPKTDDAQRKAVLGWVTHPDRGLENAPDLLTAAVRLMDTTDAREAAKLIRDYGLPRECVRTELLNEREVWAALLEDMPMTAMIRNLGKMSAIGLLTPLSDASETVVERLGSAEAIQAARVHPFAVLLALRTYAQGHGERGKLTWNSVGNVLDALDAAFYTAFKAVVPTGKRILLALDVSGSMSSPILGSSLSAREGCAAMALVTANTESNYHIIGFTGGGGGYGWRRSSDVTELDISPRQRLDRVTGYMAGLPFGGTDCSLPMIYAMKKNLKVDAFSIYTDNETWAGVHPSQALNEYRHRMGIPAKLTVTGMTSTGFSIADPNDGGMLDVVGFDASAPQIIADFIRE
jgi:60 kDa SS-A/Ro ribonucleoprotein